MDHRFRHRFDKFVGVERPPTLTVSAFEATDFVVSRVQWEWSDGGHPTQFDRADAYMVCLQRLDLPAQPYWADGRAMSLPAIRRGQFLLLDLGTEHASLVPSAVDCVSIYASRAALQRFQAEHGMPATGQLLTPLGAVHDDEAIRHLGEALLPAIEQPRAASRLWADHVALALLSRLTALHGTDALPASAARGGLAGWQERRAKEMMLSQLDGRIGLETLAAECRLSRSHFARAFKASTGVSPLRWLSLQRVERAKIMLLNTQLPLDQIAVACGFADASHLARVFVRATGQQPGAWRRSSRL
ncbi:AraC family transcriptional regulator [Sphingosinicella sp. CPCC 101087]|uniref:AraC family transcriptional regulator n=1 Tax=Sphingosinicella sp. CPCC 101087 TaxID=2497754 RepID=UPI00101D5BAB|nr:AraC family transcriptional regulator [Sphingosinicella sp. CPCC 101087]